MWVESEVQKGSSFYFTINTRISHVSMESVMAKMAAYQNRTILFVDTLGDSTGVVDRIEELGLKAHKIHDLAEVANGDTCPHIDTVVVDSLGDVSVDI